MAGRFNVAKKEDRTYDGVVYDSALEMKYYKEFIEPKMRSGTIVKCEKQKAYILQDEFEYMGSKIRSIEYVADFVLHFYDGTVVVVDVKGGKLDSVAKLKKKLFHNRYRNIEYLWVTKYNGKWIEYSEYLKLKREKKKSKNTK